MISDVIAGNRLPRAFCISHKDVEHLRSAFTLHTLLEQIRRARSSGGPTIF